ncbi:heterokaryon incompatibility protein-domain-containing protein [Xylariaceae sp. FL1019]|nr:heterokaryon incompatibility protein-domain-containing protein [Xylariaceae sp. FL1019]
MSTAMATKTRDTYHYKLLPMSIRIAELLPGKSDEPLSCLLHEFEWSNLPKYEALSYAWGDPEDKSSIIIHDKKLEITKSLQVALSHLRYEDKARLLWADAICINQSDIPERGAQVRQMRRIFEHAETVILWLGPDSSNQAHLAKSSVHQITSFLCGQLGITVSDIAQEAEVYNKIIFKNRDKIPLPHDCGFVTDAMWNALLWLYKHPVFKRVWIIQEMNASRRRVVYCGSATMSWEAIEMVAGYIILETAFSKSRGFTSAYCWWASILGSRFHQSDEWLQMLYLASTFEATDPRDVIYGLRGMIQCDNGGWLLDPDYAKTTLDVYRDSVEAAFLNFGDVNALCYVHGTENPSWIPRWDESMVFRNPFRFGFSLPWRPGGNSMPKWRIDRQNNTLSLGGYFAAVIESSETYAESLFGNAMLEGDENKARLARAWCDILECIALDGETLPLDNEILLAVAVSFSFGLGEKCIPADERTLFQNFIAYLKGVLDVETYRKYISPATTSDCADGIAAAFGKPVWDFEYPNSSFFIATGKTGEKRIGCCIATTCPGDKVFVPYGSVYPLVLRPEGSKYRIRGYCFLYGIMQGEVRYEEAIVEII